VTVPTRVDQVVKPKKTLTLSLASGSGYSVGTPHTAQTTIVNSNDPTRIWRSSRGTSGRW